MTLKINPVLLGTSNTTIYEAAAGLEGSIHGLVFSNNTTTPKDVILQFYKSTDANTYTIIDNFTIGAKKNFVWPRPINVRGGDILSAIASANDSVFATASIYEAETFSQGFNVVGEWSSSASYNVNDVVTYESNTYVAIQVNTDEQPDTSPSNWVLFAVKGETGFTGSQGIQGFTGSQGIQGFTGSQGVIGFTGSQGDIGFTGSVGFVGSKGDLGSAAPRSVTLEGPTNSESVVMFYTDVSMTLAEIRSVLRGSGSPSVTFSIRYASDASATGTEVVTSGITVTNTTTGLATTSFNNGTIPSGSFVWITTSAVSGTVNYLHVSLR